MSLKEMFVGLTAAAVFCWCVAQAGVENSVFWGATIFGAVVTLAWWGAAQTPGAGVLAAIVPIAFMFFCGMMIASQALVWLALFLLGAGIACPIAGRVLGRRLSRKALARVAVGGLLSALVMGGIAGRRGGRELDLARAKYPVESLAPRLAYEAARTPTTVGGAPLVMASSVATALQAAEQLEDESRDEYRGRVAMLRGLHEHQYDDFVRAAGFGVGRMPLPRPRYVERPELVDIAFDEAAPPAQDDWRRQWRQIYRTHRGDTPPSLHLLSRDDFLAAEGFGWIKSRLVEVAGFVPHAFHGRVRGEEKPPRWTIERLELVSLLKFATPRVYVLDHLPRMDQLSGDDAPTRKLDEFETRALATLRIQEDVVVESVGDATRMLGSLRAGRQCLECHTVQRGELLGAFSYVLREEGAGEERGVRVDPLALAAE